MNARNATTLALYGTAHLLIDACCAAAAFHIASSGDMRPETFAGLLLLYHVLAFGLQSLIGLAVDALRAFRMAAVLGTLLTVVALGMTSMPLAALIVAGIGNAVFHVGGGAISLQISPHRAAAPGVFVAPGSVGLLLGSVLGRLYPAALMPLGIATVAICLPMLVLSLPHAERNPRPRESGLRADDIVLSLILLTVAVRSLLGFLVTFPWDTRPGTLITLTLAACLGKALGGFAADWWGWRRVGVGAILASLPLLVASSALPEAAIPGMFLLNVTMPITLAAVSEGLPGHPGFAFGLPCLAVLLGAIPSLLGIPIAGVWIVVVSLLIAAASLYCGLRRVAFAPFLTKAMQVKV